MPRILVHEECEVFDAKCECGERVVSLNSHKGVEKDFLVDRKGWAYAMDDELFIPQSLSADILARSRCMECGLVGIYLLKFRTGVMKSWKDAMKHQGPFSGQGI